MKHTKTLIALFFICITCSIRATETVEIVNFVMADGGTNDVLGSGTVYGFAIEDDTAYIQLSFDNLPQITRVDNIAGGQVTTRLVSPAQWLIAAGETSLTTWNGFGVWGNWLQFADVTSDEIWRVNKNTGEIIKYVDQTTITNFTGIDAAVRILAPNTVNPFTGEHVFFEGESRHILTTAGSNTVEMFISREDMSNTFDNAAVSGGMTFDSEGNFYWVHHVSGGEYLAVHKRDTNGNLSVFLTQAQMDAVHGEDYTVAGDIMYAPDGLLYIRVRRGAVGCVLTCDPHASDPPSTLALFLTEDDLLDSPSQSANMGMMGWYKGGFCWHRFREPANPNPRMGIFSVVPPLYPDLVIAGEGVIVDYPTQSVYTCTLHETNQWGSFFRHIRTSAAEWSLIDPPGHVSITNNILYVEDIPATEYITIQAVVPHNANSVTSTYVVSLVRHVIVQITNAAATVSYSVTAYSIGGSNNANVVDMWWENSLTGGSGSVTPGSPWWTISDVPLGVGANVITVYGSNTYGATTSDSVTITRSTPAISLVITNDPATVSYVVTTYSVGGSNNANVVDMWWENSLTGDSGTATPGAPWWTISDIPLGVGANVITVYGSNTYGATTSDNVTITRSIPDISLVITNNPATVAYAVTTYSIGGSNSADVVDMWWSNNSTGDGGSVTPGTPWWTISDIPLGVGANVITVYGSNTYGVAASDSVTITRSTPFVYVALPPLEQGGERTRSTSIAGYDGMLYFTRYFTTNLPGDWCAFYGIPGGAVEASDWTDLAPAPKFVQNPPGWFSANVMKNWAGAGMSHGIVDAEPWLFMFGSISKGEAGEYIGRSLLGYNIPGDYWQVVTNNYDGGGADGACTFVSENSIYGFWKGWTPMQRWAWDPTGAGVVQQATVGTAALHPVDGVSVGHAAIYIMFRADSPHGRLIAIPEGGLSPIQLPDLPFNVGMGCAIEYVPASISHSGSKELWILRGGEGTNTGDGQGNSTPNNDVLILTFTNTPNAIAITGQHEHKLPYLTGGEGADMARVDNKMYFLRHNGATNPELYYIYITYDEPSNIPFVTITNTPQTVDYTIAHYTLGGSNNANVVDMWWENSLTGDSGTATPGIPWWTISDVPLGVGANVITVYGSNAYGNVVSDAVTITRTHVQTDVYIANDMAIVENDVTVYTLGGSNTADVVDLWWENSLTGDSGSTSPGTPWWVISDIPLGLGDNTITVYGTNVFGGIASDSVLIRRSHPGFTYYISLNGSDANDGLSRATAFGTFLHATETMRDGDTLVITEGVYTNPGNRAITELQLLLGVQTNGTLLHNITIRGEGPDKTLFRYVDGLGVNVTDAFHVRLQGSGNTLSGFKMEGDILGEGWWIAPLSVHFCSNAIVSHIWLEFPATILERTGISSLWIDGVDNVLVYRCLVDGGGVGGRALLHDKFHNMTYRNCTFVNQRAGGSSRGMGMIVEGNSGTVIENSVFANNANYGISFWVPEASLPQATQTVAHCLYWNPGLGFIENRDSTRIHVIETGTTNINPHFITDSKGLPYSIAGSLSFYGWNAADRISIDITNTAATVSYGVSAYSIGGSNSADVVDMWWTNMLNNSGGSFTPGAPWWTISDIPIAVGANNIAVFGRNIHGELDFDNITITRSTPAISVIITNDAKTVSYNISTYTIGGSNNANVVDMWWENSLTGGSGSVTPGSPWWTISDVPLGVGANVITVYGSNTYGATTSDSVTITRSTPAISLVITNDPATVSYVVTTYSVGGSNSADVVDMWWENSLTGDSGTATPGIPWWTISDIPLGFGANVITVYGSNTYGATTSDSVTITRSTPAIALVITNYSATVSEAISTYTLAGSNSLDMIDMWWENSLTGDSGTATPGIPWWTISDIPLGVGENIITVYGSNIYDDVTSDSVTITRVLSPGTRYVSLDGGHVPPFSSWATAATNIQDAVDIALEGDTVRVNDGVYAVGTRVTPHHSTLNRVLITKNITVESVNGPEVTIIRGEGPLGDSAVRGVYMTAGTLSGFTITNGHTRTIGDHYHNMSGGGVNMRGGNGSITHCIVIDNHSSRHGGGVTDGIVNNSKIIGNSSYYGGGLALVVVNNSLIKSNSGHGGGGITDSIVSNSTVIGNIAREGGGVRQGTVNPSRIYNSIVWNNTATNGANHYNCTVRFTCTTPLPPGPGNISDDPQFIDAAGGNYRLQATSPCINAGHNSYAPMPYDLDGNPRIILGTVDMGAYEYSGTHADKHALIFPSADSMLEAGYMTSVVWHTAMIQDVIDGTDLVITRIAVHPSDAVETTSAVIATDVDNLTGLVSWDVPEELVDYAQPYVLSFEVANSRQEKNTFVFHSNPFTVVPEPFVGGIAFLIGLALLRKARAEK